MKAFKKGYLKSIQTQEEYEKLYEDAMNDNLNVSVANSGARAALKKGFIIKEYWQMLGFIK